MILVTGASGNVGRSLVDALAAAGRPVRAAYHSDQRAREARAQGRDAVTIDLTKPDTIDRAMGGVDALFVMGAGGLGQFEREMNAVEAARRAGVRRIVKLSVVGATGEDFSFARIHRPIERAIEETGVAWTFLRPTSYMQNFVNFISPTIRSQHALYALIPDARFNHIDTRDVARAAAAVLTSDGHEGKAYTLTGPRSFTYREAAATIAEATGAPVQCIGVTESDARTAMKANGIPDFYAEYLVDLDRWYAEGGADITNDEVRRLTGREPTSFEAYVREFVEAFRG